ncbi:MAG: SMP-30/gluconolactonase/LRE family protein [Candidatus Sericytochromatia bacterium]|nr:SMP-30/gluconolactonase/LRE family protein [Candidatus Tanganyikabacteria bacterium]
MSSRLSFLANGMARGAALALLAMTLSVVACAPATTTASSATPTPAPTATATPTPTPAPKLAPPSALIAFDAAMGEFAEGLTLDNEGQNAYVATAAGKILKVSLATKTKTEFGTLPGTIPSDGTVYVLGLAFDAAKNLYVAVTTCGPKYQIGIYKVGSAGGEATKLASVAGFVNGIAVGSDDNLYVTESSGGKILKVTAAGVVTDWASGAALAGGDTASVCATGFGIGANGIVLTADNAYVTNSDKASLVKVICNTDGSAGAVSVVRASDCDTFRGADGLAVGPDGSLYVASNAQEAVLRYNLADKTLTTVASGSLFAFPSSLTYNGTDGALYVVNAAFGEKKTPGIVKLPIVVK